MDGQGELVRGQLGKLWPSLFRILWILLLLAGIICLVVSQAFGVVLVAIAVLLCVAVEGVLMAKKRNRAWLYDSGEGFVFTDKAGRREFDDTQVISVYLHHKRNYGEGILKSVDRIFHITIDSEQTPLRLKNRIKVDDPDPIQPFIDRTIENYREIATEALAAGSSLNGEGWSLTQQGLSFGRGQTIPFAEMIGVDEFDNQVCVWRRGQDDAVFRISASSKHAFLLHVLISDALAGRVDERGDEEPGLGRIFFERKNSFLARIAVWLGCVMLVLFAMGSAAAGAEAGPLLAVLLGLVVGGLAVLLLVYAIRSRKSFFRCHEQGIHQRTWLGEKKLRYTDVAALTYGAVRNYYNGIYTGTALSLALEPLPDSESKPIRYGRTVNAADESLDEMRDIVARYIADRWLVQVQQGQSVQWTPELIIHPDGIEHIPRGFLGRKKKAIRYGLNQIHGYDIDEGYLHVWIQGQEKSVLQASTQKRNFFPGYHLFDWIYRNQFDNDATTEIIA